MANKTDTSNQGKWGNSPGWDLVGGGSSSSSGSSTKSSSSSSSGGSHRSDNDHDSGGSSYHWGNGPDMSRRQDLAGQTVQQGRFSVNYDNMGYAKSGVKTSDSPGYEVDGVTYDGYGNAVYGGGSLGTSSIQGRNPPGGYPAYGGMTFQDYLDRSGYSEYEKQMQDYVKAAVDKAVNGYQTQINTANQDSDKLAQQAYIAKMLGQKNLDQQLSANGYAGGMADSQRIQSESNYQNNLNAIEEQRVAAVKELQGAISQAQLTGDMQTAQALSQQLSSLQSQWSSYVQQQESMNNADYWNQKQLDNSNYWNQQNRNWDQQQMDNDNYWKQQDLDAQKQKVARATAMESLSVGIMPDDETLAAAGMSQTEAAAYRSVFLNGRGAMTGTAVMNSGAAPQRGGRTYGGYNNGNLTAEQVKSIQSQLGLTADGMWGNTSSQAVGGMTAEQAWAKYGTGGLSDYAQLVLRNLRNSIEKHGGLTAREQYTLARQTSEGMLTNTEMNYILDQLGID